MVNVRCQPPFSSSDELMIVLPINQRLHTFGVFEKLDKIRGVFKAQTIGHFHDAHVGLFEQAFGFEQDQVFDADLTLALISHPDAIKVVAIRICGQLVEIHDN
jgi:hypothetical protein